MFFSTIIYTMERLNEKLSTLMETLSNIMAKRGDRIKSLAYKRAHEAILSLDRDIHTVDELKSVSGIGASSLSHMREYLEKGTLEISQRHLWCGAEKSEGISWKRSNLYC
jgi:DNA polymerase/3'-5' exonuclease PolX